MAVLYVCRERSRPLGADASPTPAWPVCRGVDCPYAHPGRWLSVPPSRLPREERPPLDERDRAIEHRSLSAAYYVLIAGMILVGCIMPISSTGWTIVNAAIFWIVAAEVVRYSVVVAIYRVQASS